MKRKLAMAVASILMLVESSCFAADSSVESKVVYSDRKAAAIEKTADQVPGIHRPVIADHTSVKLENIPKEWVLKARKDLHIAYGHSSHGSQITSGMLGLTSFRGEPFVYKKGVLKGDSIDIRDNPFGGASDLGNPDNTTWAAETEKYLDKNKDINVVMWSWCGQLSKADDAFVNKYIELMDSLEKKYPSVTFVYMTGHLDGTGEKGTLAQNNQKIRECCITNQKVLFDFADIESYDPDGIYYGDRYADAACGYDSNGDGKADRNWAQEWQKAHTKGKEWYECTAAHTEPVNANVKAYAMWWLLARVTGWNSEDTVSAASNVSKANDFQYYAEKLKLLNLFRGTDAGFDLERVPNRLEGAVMLTRLMGGEKEALDKLYPHPFSDAQKSWGNPYVGYLSHYNLAKGISEKQFGCDKELEQASYITFLLRILGYTDNDSSQKPDFSWGNALEKARDLGIVDSEYYSALKKGSFNRGHMAKLTYLALNQKIKGQDTTLLQKLVKDTAVAPNAEGQ